MLRVDVYSRYNLACICIYSFCLFAFRHAYIQVHVNKIFTQIDQTER